ncbi:MAG: hypothetical protein KF814_06110 [Nitrospiraceae bacterium]|nr:hypothetical protein [Nitrospiraceae bacterium]
MTPNGLRPPEDDITCREVAAWTSTYIDAHLHEPAKVRMALHLAACAGCRTYVEQIAAVRDALRKLPSPGLTQARLSQLREEYRHKEIKASAKVEDGSCGYDDAASRSRS